MSDTNQITVRGRVGTDPDIQVTPGGKEVTRFRLASTRSYRDASGEWHDADTEWFTVKAWTGFAKAVQDSIRRGMPVIVEGVFSCEEWVTADQPRSANVITASAIGVDIRHGLVKHFKVTRLAQEEGTNGSGAATSGTPAAGSQDSADHNGTEDGQSQADDHSTAADPALAPEPVDPDAWTTPSAVS